MSYFDPPETPAPVFAVRAFKHALFGTPETTQPNKSSRRNSTTEYTRDRPVQSDRITRPPLMRPKSSSASVPLLSHSSQSGRDAPPSPTKGILVTPGTAAARRKTVTFGESAADRKGTITSKSGLPDDFPGKFPSPWAKHEAHPPAGVQAPARKGKSQVTQALEQARDEINSRQSGAEVVLEAAEKQAGPDHAHFANPSTECGIYWKAQYDAYRTNTQREVKKLIIKRKAAKVFAQQKEQESCELNEALRRERGKVVDLEAKCRTLQAQMVKYLADHKLGEALRTEPTLRELQDDIDYGNSAEQSKRSTDGEATEMVSEDSRALPRVKSQLPPSSAQESLADSESCDRKPSSFRSTKAQPSTSRERLSTEETRLFERRKRVHRTMDADGIRNDYDIDADVNQVVHQTGTVKDYDHNMQRRDSAHTLLPFQPIVAIEHQHNATVPRTMPQLPCSPEHATEVINQTHVGPKRLYGPRASRVATGSDSAHLSEELHGLTHNHLNDVPGSGRQTYLRKDVVRPKESWLASGVTVKAGIKPESKGPGTFTDRQGREVDPERLDAARARLQARGRNVS